MFRDQLTEDRIRNINRLHVISVFVVYGIEKENTTIGALYALGVNRNQLMLHYLCLPVVVSFLAGAIGCMIGFASIGGSTIMGSCYEYFSIPNMESVYPPYLIVYGLVLPPVISALVNWIVIRGKLNRPALQMLKNEQKSQPIQNLNICIPINIRKKLFRKVDMRHLQRR